MAEAKTQSAQYLSGDDPENILANKRYQEALAALTDSLDNRKRMFDPTLLAMAQGFLAPTQTGGFGESLGNVAKNVGTAQEAEDKRNQEYLQQRLGAATQGLDLQRLKARDADLEKFLTGGPQPAVTGPLSGPQTPAINGPKAAPLPTSEGPAPVASEGALTQAAGTAHAAPSSEAPAVPAPQGGLTIAEAPEGVRVMPPNSGFMSQKEFVSMNRHDKGKSLADLLAKGAELEHQRYAKTEAGTTDYKTGIFYPAATGKYVDVPIMGEGYDNKKYSIPETVALQLSNLAQQNNFAGYKALADKFTGKTFGKTEGAPLSISEQAISNKEAETRAGKLGEKAAEKEAAVEETDATARRVYGSVTRVQDYLKQSGNYFGIFARPGITAAVGNLIKEGIQTPSGTLNLGGFEDSMRAMMPGIKQKDLDNVTKAATELAEVELAFTRLYLAKQGAVTEGERKIVRAIPGTVSSSPEVLKTRMELLKARSQYDMDVNDAFRQWQDKNPGRSYLEFERKSDLYKDIKKGFEAESEKIFGGIKAVPTSQRKQEATPAAGTPSPGFIRDPVTGVIRRKKEGE